MSTIVKMNKTQKTETEIAILQIQVKHIDDRLDEIKEDVKSFSKKLVDHSEEVNNTLKEMSDSAEKAHTSLNRKITALEKWRWMMMGAGVVIGSLGFETLAQLIKM